MKSVQYGEGSSCLKQADAQATPEDLETARQIQRLLKAAGLADALPPAKKAVQPSLGGYFPPGFEPFDWTAVLCMRKYIYMPIHSLS